MDIFSSELTHVNGSHKKYTTFKSDYFPDIYYEKLSVAQPGGISVIFI